TPGRSCRPENAGNFPRLRVVPGCASRVPSGLSLNIRVGENVDGDHGFFDAEQPAAVFLDGNARAFDLALAGLAAQLRHQLVDLPQTSRADRVTLGFEAAGRVD